ncbi:MAG: diacylglycerol/polyprenol kinase family protein [Chloroflexia bacterium]
MSGADARGVFLSFAYVLAVLLGCDLARRLGWASAEVTRKAVHIAVGIWIFPTLFLFRHWEWALVPPLVFAVLNALSLRFHIFGAIEVGERSWGTVLFPVSFAILIALYWRIARPEIAASGLMAMAWGDAMASVVGRAFGKRGYSVWGQRRTWLGSLAFVGWTALAVTLTLRFLGRYAPPIALAHGLLAGLAGALVEALSPRGTDNLTVPLATTALLFALPR